MVKKSSAKTSKEKKMNQKPKLIDPEKLKNVCKLGLAQEECHLLRRLVHNGLIVCAHKTYVDIGIIKPNCQKMNPTPL
ncbi:MAG: hypothetical protein Q7K65_05930 [Candidatus Buchananbacteria bacterium]|nr:hypothetical protein [Candidatus Buchananbacteria bacterium]